MNAYKEGELIALIGAWNAPYEETPPFLRTLPGWNGGAFWDRTGKAGGLQQSS